MNFSNLIHAQQNDYAADISAYMRRNSRPHLTSTGLDFESLAEQAAYELDCSREMADMLAVELAEEFK